MRWETSTLTCLPLLRYSLYWGGLDLNPQHLRGVPVYTSV